MAKEQLTHWRSFINPKYMGAYSFHPEDTPILTIKKCVKERVTGSNGREDDCAVLYFEEKTFFGADGKPKEVKPMIVNAKNGKTIEKLFTPFVEKWPGKKIQLHIIMEKVQGEMTNVLRIRHKEPKTDLPPLPDDKLQVAIDNLKTGAVSLASIQKKYKLSATQLQALEMALEDAAIGTGSFDNSEESAQ